MVLSIHKPRCILLVVNGDKNATANVVEVKGTAFNKQNLMNAVNNVTSATGDIIVFCYTGHGFHFEHDTQNPYPQFENE